MTRDLTAMFLLGCALGLLVVLFAGCARTLWYRPGATEADFARDKAACNYEAVRAGDPILASLFLPECLRGRGWTTEQR